MREFINPDQDLGNLSGYLVTSHKLNTHSQWSTVLKSIHCANELNLKNDGWVRFEYISQVSLLYEDEYQLPPYTYKLILRRSGNKALLLSESDAIVNNVISTINTVSSKTHLNKVYIDIDRFVKMVTDDPDIYRLTFVHAKVNAFNNSLSSLSLYGDDISRTSFFRDHLELFTCWTCGIRKISSRDLPSVTGRNDELIRISNNGRVSFDYKKSNFGENIDNALGYLSQYGLLMVNG